MGVYDISHVHVANCTIALIVLTSSHKLMIKKKKEEEKKYCMSKFYFNLTKTVNVQGDILI